jgi:SAM-dependent methyltransferase
MLRFVARGSFTPADAERFYDRFGKKQDMQVYEHAAIARLVALGDFEQASAVFEVGCGTGRVAAALLETRLPPTARYVGVDISATMVDLTERRLAPWRDRVIVRHADATAGWPSGTGECDRFLATYVLDLLAESAARSLLREAHRLLRPQGLLCVISMSEGRGWGSKALTSVLKTIYAWNPGLVGGCRPVRVAELLDQLMWSQQHREIVCSWGICSEVTILARQ